MRLCPCVCVSIRLCVSLSLCMCLRASVCPLACLSVSLRLCIGRFISQRLFHKTVTLDLNDRKLALLPDLSTLVLKQGQSRSQLGLHSRRTMSIHLFITVYM